MKKYFVYINDKQEGPFDLEDLKNSKISRNNLIWFDTLDKWTKAEHIEELKEIFALRPPPMNLPPPILTPPPLPIIEKVKTEDITQSQKNEEKKSTILDNESVPKKKKNYLHIVLITMFSIIAIGSVVYYYSDDLMNIDISSNSPSRTTKISSSNNSSTLTSNGENVNMRGTPSLDGDVIYQLGFGEEVTYLNQATSFKTEVMINYVLYNNKWYKVALKRNNNIQGWVHGGFITKPKNIE